MFGQKNKRMAAPAQKLAAMPFDGRVPAPDYVTLETTRYCNLRCRMCLPYVNGITVTGPHMPMDVFRGLGEQLFPAATRFQPSVSGEPMMSKGIMDMVRLAASYGVKIEMCTNGTLFSEPRIRTLIHSLGKIKISFDGASKEVFEEIREGAKYERVVRNVKALVAASEKLPEGQRPIITFACTLMERNIRELPELVRLAHSLGVDNLGVNHLFPNTAEMKGQSLVHHREVGRRCIAEAVSEAEKIGFPLEVFALDQVTAETALGEGWSRRVAAKEGIVEGFEAITVNRVAKPYPTLSPAQKDYPQIQQRRIEGQKKYWFQPATPQAKKPQDVGPIWVCDWLWSRTWGHLDGAIRPCCITGAPVTGFVDENRSFSHVWNNRNMRVMRQRLVAKDPVPFCRGCRMIREISDPSQVHHYLGGRRPPEPQDLEDIPELLTAEQVGKPWDRALLDRSLEGDKPIPDRANSLLKWSDGTSGRRAAIIRGSEQSAPELSWPGTEDGRYQLEFSSDGFDSIAYATDPASPIVEPTFRLPDGYWDMAPLGVTFDWRVILVDTETPRIIWQGQLEKAR